MNSFSELPGINCLMLLCLFLLAGVARAEDFSVVDGSTETLQSRRFDDSQAELLLRACLAVIQDLRFQISESELEPGLLVAESPGASGSRVTQTLTVSLQEVSGRANSYQVRLSLSALMQASSINTPRQPDYTDFYQDFFTHLNRELFKERHSP